MEDTLGNGFFRVNVELESGDTMEVVGYLAGKMRRNRIRLADGDRVRIELSPYDLERGRIVYRL